MPKLHHLLAPFCLLLSGLLLAVVLEKSNAAATGQDATTFPLTLAQPQQPSAAAPQIPPAMIEEHRELNDELGRITGMQTPVGEAGRQLEAVLRPHFQKEEKLAMPPLGLLPELAQDRVTSQMASILPLTQQLRQAMPQMLAEHKAIQKSLAALREQARLANQVDVIRFTNALEHHARLEEQVLYPTALVVGELVQAKTQAKK